jgi:Luciferase-like monooxygenase
VGALGTDLPDTGEVVELRARADLLDEGIDLIRALWDGGTSYHGRHYSYQTGRLDLTSAARPVQARIPIWVVGVWPAPRSMRRVLRCDGVIPQYGSAEPGPADASAVRDWLTCQGKPASFDLIADGETPADDPDAAAAQVTPWAAAGCTWWLETRWAERASFRGRIEAGPPKR